MEIMTGALAPTLTPDEARRLVLEMAAVVRTIFGAPVATDQQVASAEEPAVIQDVATPVIAAIPVPALAVPALPVPALPVPALPVPALPVPELAVLALDPIDPVDSAERHSLALLQEIAFLDV